MKLAERDIMYCTAFEVYMLFAKFEIGRCFPVLGYFRLKIGEPAV